MPFTEQRDPRPQEPLPPLSHVGIDDLLTELRERATAVLESQQQQTALLEAVVSVSADLDLPVVLKRIVSAACLLVGARFGALGVLGPGGDHLAEFVTYGLGRDEEPQIGTPPKLTGVLGELIRSDRPIRLDDITDHPLAAGFPPGHPRFRSFLGVPLKTREAVFGNLYLSEKADPDVPNTFSARDEEVVRALAAAAGVAIENARLYEQGRRRQAWLRVAAEATRSVLSGAGARTLAQVARDSARVARADGAMALLCEPGDKGIRVRSVVGVRGPQWVHTLRRHGEAPTASGAQQPRSWIDGQAPAGQDGEPMPVVAFDLADLFPRTAARTPRFLDAAAVGAVLAPDGDQPIVSALWIPLWAGASLVGAMLLTWTDRDRADTVTADLDLLGSLGEQVALAIEVAMAQRAMARVAVLEDRDRIARDLHDLVIQRLFAVGLAISATARSVEGTGRARLERAVDDLDETIREVRSTIFHLHTNDVVQQGFASDLQSVVHRAAGPLGFLPSLRTEGQPARLDDDLAGEALAVVTEALSNVARHAGASEVDVRVVIGKELLISVQDNGSGLPENAVRGGGLANLAARARSNGGQFEVSEGPGCILTWRVPLG